MADFCLQCSIDMGFGVYSDFDHLQSQGELPEGQGYGVLCEGCGPTLVDHMGRCLGCCMEADRHRSLSEVYGWAVAWQARRSGPLGRLWRLRDRLLGTPWEPGLWHELKWRWHDFWGRVWHSGDKPIDDFFSFNHPKLPTPYDVSQLGVKPQPFSDAFREMKLLEQDNAGPQGREVGEGANRPSQRSETGEDGTDPARVPR